MAVLDTSNAGTTTVYDQPDWSMGVSMEMAYETAIFTSRSNLEQRHRKRKSSSMTITWAVTGLTKAELDARRASDYLESRTVCRVPFWPMVAPLDAAMSVETSCTIDRTPTPEFWRAGDWIYIYDPVLGGEFREVASQGSPTTQLTLVSKSGAILFPQGAKVWPCRDCEKDVNEGVITRSNVANLFNVKRSFTSLGG